MVVLGSLLRPFLFRILLCLSICGPGIPCAEARGAALVNLYQVLGIASTATQEEITDQYQRKIRKAGITEKQRLQLTLAHAFLTDPDLRKSYDSGSPLLAHVPPEARENVAKLLDPVDPPAASALRKVGTVGLTTASSMANFYVGMAAISAKKCFETKDPLYCKEYAEGLSSPSGHLGFLVFSGTSHVASAGLVKVFGKSMVAQSAAGFGGMAAGSVMNSLYSEIAAMPETDEYFHLRQKFPDEEERTKRRSELRKIIYQKTFGDPLWWREKSPEVAALISSALASQITVAGFNLTAEKALKQLTRASTGGIAAETEPSRLKCGAVQFLQKIVLGTNIKGKIPKFAHSSAAEIAQLMIFMGYDGLLHPVADKLWDQAVLTPELQHNRKTLLRDRTQLAMRRAPIGEVAEAKASDQKQFEDELTQSSKLWESSRKRQMKPVDEIMALHSKELQEFDQSTGKAHAFYQWLMNGAGKPKDKSWESLRDAFYNDRTSKEEIEKDAHAYLKSFFQGADPKSALTDRLDLHGIPVPGRASAEVTPYRATSARQPMDKDQSYAHLLHKLQAKDYSSEEKTAFADLTVAVQAARYNRIMDYEAREEKLLLQTLTSKIKPGVLESIQTEISDLEKLKLKLHELSKIDQVTTKITQLNQEALAVKNLIKYYQTPVDKREEQTDNINDLINALDPNSQAEWLQAVNYYQHFILK